jgi:hypothetical protein
MLRRSFIYKQFLLQNVRNLLFSLQSLTLHFSCLFSQTSTLFDVRHFPPLSFLWKYFFDKCSEKAWANTWAYDVWNFLKRFWVKKIIFETISMNLILWNKKTFNISCEKSRKLFNINPKCTLGGYPRQLQMTARLHAIYFSFCGVVWKYPKWNFYHTWWNCQTFNLNELSKKFSDLCLIKSDFHLLSLSLLKKVIKFFFLP